MRLQRPSDIISEMAYHTYKNSVDDEPNVGSALQNETGSKPLDERTKTRGEANSSEGGAHGPGGYQTDRPAYRSTAHDEDDAVSMQWHVR